MTYTTVSYLKRCTVEIDWHYFIVIIRGKNFLEKNPHHTKVHDKAIQLGNPSVLAELIYKIYLPYSVLLNQHLDKISCRTPGKINLYKQASTPGKFTVYEDSEDDIIREMKRKNFKIGIFVIPP